MAFVKNLLIIKEKLLAFYGRFSTYINLVMKFLLALFSFLLIGKAIGTHDILANPLICFAIAVMCAFVPVSVTVICATVLALIHLFGMSMELAAIATIVVLIVYLLYFRFAPKTGILLILTPLLFYIKIPYIIPVIAALTVGMTGIVPVFFYSGNCCTYRRYDGNCTGCVRNIYVLYDKFCVKVFYGNIFHGCRQRRPEHNFYF